jgi:hypothetical protein
MSPLPLLAQRFGSSRRLSLISCTALLSVLFTGPAGFPDQPPVTDVEVEAAIYRAVNWLNSQRDELGHWERHDDPKDKYYGGHTALALLALLYAGEDPKQDDMNLSLEWLAPQVLNATYTHSLRAQALALVPGEKYRRRLKGDLEWLVYAPWPRGTQHGGGYDYVSTAGRKSGWYDNSNSQFGVLGAWMATEAGLAMSDLQPYWLLMEDHWTAEQNADGGWPYRHGESSTGSMTAAGLATLYIVLDRAHARTGHKQATDLIQAIDRGLSWLGREYTPDNPRGSPRWKYYYLYGVERAGRASGRKYFRDKDWFRVGAADLLGRQEPDGSWPGSGTDEKLEHTCFALLFLSHGRAPLLCNKLEHGDDWDNKLRDAAGLARYAQHTTERLLNWQIVSLDGPLTDLLEAPLVYMSGATAWEFDDVQTSKLREYCRRGGMILAVADGDSSAFSESLESLAERIFPEFPVRPVTGDHPLISGEVHFPIGDPPPLLEVHNGLRTLMLICTRDIARAWNRYQVREREQDFQLGFNIYLYATDKTSFRSRLETPEIPREQVAIVRTVRVARVKYDGYWDVEPHGWSRLRNYMNNQSATRLLAASGVPLDALNTDEVKVAYMTGTRAFELSPAESAGLRRFVTGGGTLLADAAGGSREFLESFERHVTDALKLEPRIIPDDDPILTGKNIAGAARLSSVGYRRAARAAGVGRKLPLLKGYRLERHWGVVYSPLDVSTGLLGTPVYGCRGYDDDTSRRILRNLLLYANLSTAQKARLNESPGP